MSDIQDHETIWFPGIYSGRQGVYAQLAGLMPEDELIELVQRRAQEDGEWAIENGFVGDNEDIMRKMMAWVSTPNHIRQCLSANLHIGPTVDWICRDLANASKWVGGSRG